MRGRERLGEPRRRERREQEVRDVALGDDEAVREPAGDRDRHGHARGEDPERARARARVRPRRASGASGKQIPVPE